MVMGDIPYQIIFSNRKTVSIECRADKVIVRAPRWYGREKAEALLREKESWIRAHMKQLQNRQTKAQVAEPITPEELKQLTAQAKRVIPARVAYYAKLVGVTYGTITIRHQKSRWGSCSAKGNLNFNCLLMLTPQEVQDAVIVHELCHRKQMNHSKKFSQEVYRVYPAYEKWMGWLKKEGPVLIARMVQGS